MKPTAVRKGKRAGLRQVGLLMASVAVLGLGGCSRFRGPPAAAGPGAGEAKADVPLMGLQRGSRWSVITVRPPSLQGPHFNLMLKNKVLAGTVRGANAPGGSLRVTITEEHAEGFGPLGPISMDFYEENGATVIDGTWNGGRVHIVMRDESLVGTVATNSFFYGRTNPTEAGGLTAFSRNSRLATAGREVDPLAEDISCEYVLQEPRDDGSLSGISTCAGMPQNTRLEIPAIAQAWMTRGELLTVLVAVLAAPPTIAAEDFGPRFTPPATSTPSRTPAR